MISVAMASYNGEKYILRQLESIKNSTVCPDEVIICDDCSTDKTVDICRKFILDNKLSGWQIIENENNLGYCLNFYKAIDKCSGDIIFLSDQDDEWCPDKTEKMLNCMNENPDITVLSSRYDVIDSNSQRIENSGVTYLGDKFDNSIEYVDAEGQIGCSHIRGFSICFRSELKEVLKPIDLQSLLSHDWLISMLGSVTGKTAILNTVLTHYRYHGDNVTLSSMSRKTRKRELSKRIRGIRESINGHEYILSVSNDYLLNKHIKAFIDFEKKRVNFLESRNILIFLSLAFYIKQYNRYYKGNGMRVYIGDLVYSLKNK